MKELTIGLNLLGVNSCWVKVYEAEEVKVLEESLGDADVSAISLSNVASLIAPQGGHHSIFDPMGNDMIKDSRVCLRSWFIGTNLSNTLFLCVQI